MRDSKRPKERSQDREYRQRYSVTPGKEIGGQHPADEAPFHDNGFTSNSAQDIRRSFQSPTSVPSPHERGRFTENRSPDCDDLEYQEDVPFAITLIYEGERVQHEAWSGMAVAQLMQDAARIFRLPPPISSIVLMLFGLNPSTLRADGMLSDPPRVRDGATVLVFRIGAPDFNGQQPRGGTPVRMGGGNPGSSGEHQMVPALPQNPKFLGNFKLSKFDGAARQYLSYH